MYLFDGYVHKEQFSNYICCAARQTTAVLNVEFILQHDTETSFNEMRLFHVVVIFVGILLFFTQLPIWTSLPCFFLGRHCPLAHEEVHGIVDPAFVSVLDELKRLYAIGHDSAAQVAIFHKGKLVVDAASGFLDAEHTQRFEPHHLAAVFSCSKVVESLVIAMLVDRKLLSYDEPIARYWPEFGVNDKQRVTVRDLMMHRASLAVLSSLPFDIDTALAHVGTAQVDELLAASVQTLRKNVTEYHSFTRGMFADALVRRVDPQRRGIGEFLRDEVLTKLSTNDRKVEFYIGNLLDEHAKRVGHHRKSPTWTFLAHTLPQLLLPASVSDWLFPDEMVRLSDFEIQTSRKFLASVIRWLFGGEDTVVAASTRLTHSNGTMFVGVADIANSERFRRLPLASASGVSNAYSMARIAAELSVGGGVLLSRDAFSAAAHAPTTSFDEVLNANMTYTQAGWSRGRIKHGWMGWAGESQRSVRSRIVRLNAPTTMNAQRRRHGRLDFSVERAVGDGDRVRAVGARHEAQEAAREATARHRAGDCREERHAIRRGWRGKSFGSRSVHND